MQKLYRIKDKNKHVRLLKFNDAQWQIIGDIANQRPIRHFSLKSRQIGISTFWLLWWLDETIWNPNTTTGILAHKWESLHHLWSIIEFAYKNYPEPLPLKQKSARALEFANSNSKIFISLSIRSTALHNLHISEWCFCDDDEVKATLGACSPVTNISGESTGNGVGNDGYETYQQAKQGNNEYIPRFMAWFTHEDYQLPLMGIRAEHFMNKLSPDEKKLKALMMKEYGMTLKAQQVLFRRQKIRQLKDMFPQEFPETDMDAFITSGQHYFNLNKTMALLSEAKDWQSNDKYYERGDDYIAFEEPNRRDIFVAGADTSEGVQDYSVLKIINVSHRREAFVYRAKCGVKTFYQVCDKWCRAYNRAKLAVEDNNTGHAVLLGLTEDCRYPNLYKRVINTRLKKGVDAHLKHGWHTDKLSRTLMLNDLKYALEGDDSYDEHNFLPEFTVYDVWLLQEVLTFINNNGKYEAEEGKHDDNIIASAIAFQIYKEMRRFVTSERPNMGVYIGSKREAI